MQYEELVSVYAELESTSATTEKTGILARLFEETTTELLPVVVRLSRGEVFPPWSGRDLGVSGSLTKEALVKSTGISESTLEDWWRETGDLGNAAAKAIENRTQETLFSDRLRVEDVHGTLDGLHEVEGEGSQAKRIDALAKLFSNASPDEAKYIVRTVVGAMRLGVGEGLVRDAIATAFLEGADTPIDSVERAHQVTNDFGVVAVTAKTSGITGLRNLDIELFRPIKVMLAQKADGIEAGLGEIAPDPGAIIAEYKYDGIRTQIHRQGDDLQIYTRRLENVTAQFPEVEAAARDGLERTEYIVEGEIVAYDPTSRAPLPFQELSKRVKRKHSIEETADEIPVVVYLFDILYLEGQSLLDASLRTRLDALTEILAPIDGDLERAAYTTDCTVSSVNEFYREAIDAGHEGLMLKNLEATYQPGSRVGYMMKLKPTMEPLDLIITRAKWSEGRRSEYLGRVYLACRDSESGELREVGRMATGFSDEELAEVTARLEPLVVETTGREVEVEPEVVVTVEYEEIQASTEYDSGYALRFPRFDGFRDDLGVAGIDSLSRVRDLFDAQ